MLCGTAAGTAVAIQLTQRTRYARQASGLNREYLNADLKGVLCITLAVVALGTAGIYMVLFSAQ